MIRFWHIGEELIAMEEPTEPVGWNVFWYCAFCSKTYARAFISDNHTPWKALGGCCPRCFGNRFTIPGSLETIMFVDWKVPVEIARYQLNCEIRFTTRFDHPWNKEDNSANLERVPA